MQLLTLLLTLTLAAAAAGTAYSGTPSSAVNYGPGAVFWGSDIVSVFNSPGYYQLSDYRIYYNLGLSVPTGYIIDGVVVTFSYTRTVYESGNVRLREVSLRLSSGSLAASSAPKTMTKTMSSSGSETHGTSSDLWGMSGSAESIRNTVVSSSFGVAVKCDGYAYMSSSSSGPPLERRAVEASNAAGPELVDLGGDAAELVSVDAAEDDVAGDRRLPPSARWTYRVLQTGMTVTVHAHQGVCSAESIWPTTNAGASANLGCSAGYTGSYYRPCSLSAVWQSVVDTCTPIPDYCSLLTAPTNGAISTSCASLRSITEVCGTFSCNGGYALAGSTSRTCSAGPTWSGSAASCSLITDYCPPPPSPPNFASTSCARSVGSTCVYACASGYTLSGSNTLTCSSAGSWSGSLGSCAPTPNYCPALSNPPNGLDPPSYSRTIGSAASPYSCNAGYSLSGSTSRTCVVPGTWSSSPPTCSLITNYCPSAPPPPPNGAVASCPRSIGSTCSYTCLDGYEPSGSLALTCASGPTWSGSLGACPPKPNYCPVLADPTDGKAPSSYSRTIGSVASPYTCDPGFIVTSGSTSRTCEPSSQSAGVWSGSAPTCGVDASHCPPAPPPPPFFSIVSCSSALDGECVYTCANGYTNSGGDTLTCSVDGSWSGSLGSCSLTSSYCAALTVPPEGTRPACAGTLGEVCGPVSCNDGYSLSGSTTRTCEDAGPTAGSWTGSTSSCDLTPDYCNLASPPANGALGSCTRTLGGSCSAACNDGYSTSGATTATCSVGPAWSTAFGACTPTPGYCPHPGPPANGALGACTGTLGSSCGPATCGAGYTLSGTPTRTCTAAGPSAGAYSGSPPSCALTPNYCPLPTPPNNGVLGACTRTLGGSCTFSCDNGYSPSGTSSITCSAGPAWSASFGSCVKTPNYCPPHPPLTDGTNPSCTNELGEDCGLFACNPGFEVIGSTQRTCTDAGPTTGSWTGSAPSCSVDSLYCGVAPLAPGNGTRGACDRSLGGTCAYACDTAYSLVGSSQLTCSLGPTWSGTTPTCTPLDNYCPPISTVADGVAPSCTNRIHEQCGTFACNPGFTLFGDPLLTCGIDGDWVGTIPFCSSTDPALSLVFSPQTVVVSADGPGWALAVQPRSALNDTLVSSGDVVALLHATTPVTISAPSVAPPAQWNGVTSSFDILLEPTIAYSYLINIVLNGVAIGDSPYSLTVVPGVPSAATSIAAGVGLGIVTSEDELFAQNERVEFVITPRDQHGNLIAVAPSPPTSPFTATIKGDAALSVPVEYVASSSGPAGYVYAYTVPTGGLLTLSVTLNAIPIADSPWLVQVRAICRPGEQLVRITGPCVPCESNTYASPSATECLPCPPATLSPAGSASLANCTCAPGSFLAPSATPDAPCDPCPLGAVCPGSSSPPFPQPGFYQVDAQFVACPQAAACLGSGACARGYRGQSCSDCATGWYRLGSKCYECDQSKAALVIAAAFILLLAFVSFLVYLNSRESHNRMYTAAAFMIGFNSLQISALYGEIDLEWHPVARDFFNILSIANLNVELTSPECSVVVADPWLFKWIMTLLIPVLMVLLLALAFALGSLHRLFVNAYGASWAARHPRYHPAAAAAAAAATTGDLTLVQVERNYDSFPAKTRLRIGRFMGDTVLTPAALRQAVVRTFFQLFIFAYLPLAAATMRFFECERVAPGSSDYVLASAPSVACYNAQYWKLIAVAIFFVILYAVGIPAATFLLLRSRKASFDTLVFHLKYGFLVARFRDAYYAFEVAIMARKFFVIVAIVVFHAPDTEAIMAALVLVASVVHVAHVGPYTRHFHNRLSMAALLTSCVVLFGGTASSSAYRHTLVLGGLAANVLVIIFGVIVEFRNMVDNDKEALAEALAMDDPADAGEGFEMATFADDFGNSNYVSMSGASSVGNTAAFAVTDGPVDNPVFAASVAGDTDFASFNASDDSGPTSAAAPPLPLAGPPRPAPAFHSSIAVSSSVLDSDTFAPTTNHDLYSAGPPPPIPLAPTSSISASSPAAPPLPPPPAPAPFSPAVVADLPPPPPDAAFDSYQAFDYPAAPPPPPNM